MFTENCWIYNVVYFFKLYSQLLIPSCWDSTRVTKLYIINVAIILNQNDIEIK
jgi:hypothetical protein